MTATATEVRLPLDVIVRARDAATGWINAFSASSTDENRAAIHKTLCIEWFDAGIQLVATDGTVLFRTWVQAESESAESRDWPDLAEVPNRSVVVMDSDGFGLAFMRTLLSVTGDEDHQFDTLHITSAAHDEEATIALGAEFMAERVTLRACGQRLDLRVYDGEYPNWRGVRLGIEEVERVDGMTVASRIMGLVGKLKGVTAVDLEFYGDKRHIGFVGRGDGMQRVRGLLMPMRREEVDA